MLEPLQQADAADIQVTGEGSQRADLAPGEPESRKVWEAGA
jgi:hypothetical protein